MKFATSPTHFLAELIRCKACNGNLVKINGRHYGCCNAKGKICSNEHLLQGKGLEALILNDLKEKLLTGEQEVYQPMGSRSYYVVHTNIHTLSLLGELQNQ